VGEGPLQVKTLVSTLYRAFENRAAIVVGGGPSAPEQLAALGDIAPVVISANGHAVKLGLTPDFIVCKDHVHTETKELMEPALRAIGAPIVSRQYWADYRLPEWPVQGNSGMMALGFAILLGCRPVIPIGFDCYQTGTYFHAPDAPNVSRGLRSSMWDQRYRRLAAKLECSPIRALDGVLTRHFPHYSPNENFGVFHMPVALRAYKGMPVRYVRALNDAALNHDLKIAVPPGTVVAVSPSEQVLMLRRGCVEIVDSGGRDMVISRLQATADEGVDP
jgi:hypothetical protein